MAITAIDRGDPLLHGGEARAVDPAHPEGAIPHEELPGAPPPLGAGCTTGSGTSERIFRKSGSSGFSGPSSSTASWSGVTLAMSRSGADTSKREAETAKTVWPAALVVSRTEGVRA